jgi:hypothetical protein
VRGSQQTARLIAVAVVVLGALALVALAARSDRAPTLTAVPAASAPPVDVGAGTASPKPIIDSSRDRLVDVHNTPSWLVWTVVAISVVPLLMGLYYGPAMIWMPVDGLPWFRRREPEETGAPEVDDEVEAVQLAAAVEDGLRELDQGGPGEGVVASWVRLERAAANAGTHRAAPDTPSELAGRMIDRHAISSTPLLRLADLYREARFSRHELPESARTEARAIMERLRRELEASPVGHR